MKVLRTHGSALITALFIMAIVAIAATAMALRVQIDIRRTNLTLNADRSYALAQGVAYWAAADLIDQQKKKLVDQNNQSIHIEGYENAKVTGFLEDAQARFNINNLSIANDANKQAIATFTRLIQWVAPDYSNQAHQIALATSEWVSPSLSDLNSPTREFYEKVKPSYKISHKPMSSISELRLVAGVTPALYRKLEPYIFAIPDETKSEINLNSVSKIVLQALEPNLTADQLDNFIKKREQLGGFNDNKQLNELPIKIGGVIKSNYFLIHAHVELDKIKQDVFTLLKRQDKEPYIITVWESRGSL